MISYLTSIQLAFVSGYNVALVIGRSYQGTIRVRSLRWFVPVPTYCWALHIYVRFVNVLNPKLGARS